MMSEWVFFSRQKKGDDPYLAENFAVDGGDGDGHVRAVLMQILEHVIDGCAHLGHFLGHLKHHSVRALQFDGRH